MSFEVMAEAVKQNSARGIRKLVLLMIANYASAEDGTAYPSMKRLADDCGVSVRTVLSSIRDLEKLGLIEVIQRFSNGVQQSNIYRVARYAESAHHCEEFAQGVRKKRQEATQNLRTDTVIQPVNEPENRNASKSRGSQKESIGIPSWIPPETWDSFAEHRKTIRKPMTAAAAKLIIAKLERWKKEGQDPVAVLNQSIEAGWTGIFQLKDDRKGNAPNNAERQYRDLN